MTDAEARQQCSTFENHESLGVSNSDGRNSRRRTIRAMSEIDVVPPEMICFNHYSHLLRKHETASQTGEKPAKPTREHSTTSTRELWLQMVNHVVQSRVIQDSPEEASAVPEKDPKPLPDATSDESNHIPLDVKVPEKHRSIALQRVMSEITLNPSQHPAPSRPNDIVLLPRSGHNKMVSRRGKVPHNLPVPSVLGNLYPDYVSGKMSGGSDDIASFEGHATNDSSDNDENGAFSINRSNTSIPTQVRHSTHTESSPLSLEDTVHERKHASYARDSFLFKLSKRQLISDMKHISHSTFANAPFRKQSQRRRKTFHMPTFKSFPVGRVFTSKTGDGTVVGRA